MWGFEGISGVGYLGLRLRALRDFFGFWVFGT